MDVWLADSGATHHMTPVRDRLYDFRPCTDEDVDLAGGSMSIKGWGKLNVRFLSGTGEDASLALSNVAYVPTFSKNLFSLEAAARNSHEAIVNENGTSLMDGRLHFTKYRDLHALKAYRLLPHTEANATIAPGLQYRSTYDINHFHCSYGHLHEALLHDTARQLGVKLTGELQPCSGCSMGKGLRKAIPSTTTTRATKLERVFIDLSGKKSVASIGGSHYCMIIGDDYTRFTWVHFLKKKSDSGKVFENFLGAVRHHGEVWRLCDRTKVVNLPVRRSKACVGGTALSVS